MARMSGYANLHELHTFTTGYYQESLKDSDVKEEIVYQRRTRYVAAMVDAGIEQSVAIDIVARVSPTGARYRATKSDVVIAQVADMSGFPASVTRMA